MLEIRDLTKRFGDTVVLNGVTLSIPAGHTTVLLGPSGCGKSTLLRAIIGLLIPDRGEIVFDGEPVTASNALSVRQRMGYVIQSGGLFPHLTARQNVLLMSKYLRRDPAEAERRLAQLGELVQMNSDMLARYPTQLSGGQKQRVSLMRALMLDPKVLLLDEPMGALDPLIRAELQNDLRRIFTSLKKTVILVTHDMGEAAILGDRIALFKSGGIVQHGTLDELVRRPADPFVSEFINAQRNPLDALAAREQTA